MLTVICPGEQPSQRCIQTLEYALRGKAADMRKTLDQPLENTRILFAVSLNEGGVNHGYFDLLAYLRTHPGCLSGSVAGVLVDGESNLYTKAVGRELVLAANLAGCTSPAALWWRPPVI